jgi:hypothetical protein
VRFRHFTGTGSDLDDQISGWIQEGADIHFMSHSQAPDGLITICFVYQESFAAQERRLTAEQGMHESAPTRLPPERVHVESEGVG